VLLILVISLGSASGATAQESTPEPLPPVNTPTAEPSQTPTPTATTVPSETPIPTVTLDPNLDFFASDFTTGNTTGWMLTPGWSVLDEAGNGYLSTSAPNETALINGVIWDHVSLVARIGLAPGNSATVAFRSGIQSYTLTLDATGGLTLYKDQTVLAVGVVVPVTTDPVTPPPMTWYTLSLTASGGAITASVDGVEQINYVDPQPLLSGAIAFSSGAANTGEVRLDDVVVQRLPEPVPTPVPTEEPVETVEPLDPEVTPEPTEPGDPTVTPEPVETLDPEATPEITPEPIETLDPEATPEITPEPIETLDPEATPELDPEATPEITPETDAGLADEIVAKLGTVLADTVELTTADQLEEAQSYAARYGAEFDDADRIAVNVWNATDGPMGDFIALVETAGGEVIYVQPDHLQAYLPISSLEALAALDMIQAITLPVKAVSSTSGSPADADQGELTPADLVSVATFEQASAVPQDVSQPNAGEGSIRPHSLDILGVNSWTEAGVTGVGVNVAIISTGFGSHTSNSDQSCVAQAGTVWFNGGASTSFGTATTGTEMAEVICDIAPNANVYRYRAQDANRTGQALNAAISGFGSFPPADVIVVGLDPLGANGAFQTALQTAYNQNIPVIVAAGDTGGNLSTSFTYSGAGTVSIVAEETTLITVQRTSGTPVGTTLSLDTDNWSQSQAAGNNVQYTNLGGGSGSCSGTTCLFTLSFNGASTANYTVSVSGGSSEISVTPSDELAVTPDGGDLTELASEDLAISVGAVCANPSAHYPIKASSSRGPTGQDNNSNIQPSVVAPAGVSTSISLNPLGPNNCNSTGTAFDGTSSAAAHVGGMTALLLSNPSMGSRFNTSGAPAGLVVDNIKHYLQTRTIDPNRDGFDNAYGAGVVQLGNPEFNFGFEQNIGTGAGNLPGGVNPVYVSTAYNATSGEANGTPNAPYTHPAHAISAVENGSANAVIFMPGEYVSSFSAVDNLALYAYEHVDEFVSTNSAIWVNDSYANTGGIAVIDVSDVIIAGFNFEGSSPDYLATTPSTSLARVSPIFVDGSSDVEIASNYFASFDRPLTIFGTGPDPTNDVRLLDNVFDDFFVENDQSTAALQIFGSGLTTRILVQNNIFQNNSVPRDTASAKQEAILSIQESQVTIISSQFRNNEGEAVIAINQWFGGQADAALPKDSFRTEPIEIFGSLFQENDLTGSLVQVLQGVNFAFINNTVVENVINEGGFGSNANYITIGWDGVGTAGAQPWHVSDHEFDIHNNLFYRNDLTGTGGLVQAVAASGAVGLTCSSVDGLGNNTGAQGNWVIPDTPSGPVPGGSCGLPSAGATPDGNGNLVTSTINGVAYDISDELDREAFETLVFFTTANDPNHPYRLNASNVVPTQLNPGVDPGPYGAVTADSLVDTNIITGPLDPKAVDVLGIGRFFNQQTEAPDSIDIGAYETGDPEDVRFINNAVNGDTIPPDSPGATGYKNYVDGTGEFTFVGLEDQTVSIDLNRYLTGGYRPYTFNLTANTTIQNFDPETPCGGTLFSFDQPTGVLTVCPPDDFHNADLTNPAAQIVFEYDAIGVLNTGSALDGQLTVEFLPLSDSTAPRDANGNDEIQFIVTDLSTPINTVLAPNPNFASGFALPDPLDVDYPFAVSDIQVDFTAPGFTRDLFPDGLTDPQINTLVQNAYNSTTGEFSWTPLPGVTGRFEFTYSVTSGDTRVPPNYTSTASGVKTNNARRAQVRIVNSIATPGRYDNTSLNVLFAGDWRPIYLPRTDVHSATLHRIEQNNRSFSINFLGDAFVVAFRGNPSTGSVQFEIDHNDNGQFLPLDSSVLTNMQCSILSKPTVVSTQLPDSGRFVFGCQGLENIAPNQLRTLRVTTTSSARVNLDYIDIRGRTLTPNFYNDNDVALVGQRTGQWQNTDRSDAIGGSLMRSDTQGSSISFSIDGNSVDTLAIYHTVDDRHGPMRVAITGLLPFIVDTGDTTGDPERQQPFVVSNLPSGTLNVTITNETQDRIVIEGVELFADRQTLTPGLYDSHDPAINYIGPWNNRLRPEPLFDSMWLNLDRRGSAVFNFDGDGIVIYHTMNADRDFFEVCFNGDYNNCERVAAEVGARWWSNRQVLSAPSSGPNTVEIRSANDSAFSIEGIEVLDGQDPLAPGYYEEDNSEMRYDGFWRPRLSLLSLGNNIQETQAGSVTFQVDAAEFEGLGFYYRGNTKYGPVRVCRVGGLCTTFDQFRSTRIDGLLEIIDPADLSMPVSGIQTIRIDRPSGTDFINIEAIEIVGSMTPGFYNNNTIPLTTQRTGQWQDVDRSDAIGGSFMRSDTQGSSVSFTIDGDSADTLAIYHTVDDRHGPMRVAITGLSPFIVDTGDTTGDPERQQPFVVSNLPSGTLNVTITNETQDRIVIEGVELFADRQTLTPGLYDSHDPAINYIGPWNNRLRPEPLFDSMWLNLDRRGSAVFNFDGDGIVIYHTMNADRDFFEVCFNGDYNNCERVAAEVGARWWSNRQVLSAPSSGPNTVEIRSANDSAFSIEGIEVLDGQDPLAPGYYEEDNSEMRYDGFWRPRLSLLSLGNNIQETQAGSVTFQVDAAEFEGLGFYYRGNTKYGSVRVCRVGGSCVTFNQFRSTRIDGLLEFISASDLGMPGSGIQTIRIDRPSGSAFINIEGLEIVTILQPDLYQDYSAGLNYAGSWSSVKNTAGPVGESFSRAEAAGASMTFTVDGDAVDYMAIYHTMNPLHGSFRVQVQGTPDGGGASTEYINEVVDVNSATERFWSQVKVIPNIGPGTQSVTITSLSNDFVQIEAIELLEEAPVLQPGLYNSHEPSLQFLGNWQNRERDGAEFGNYWLNLDRRVSLVFEIDGDGVVIFHTMNSDRDRFEICFNGDDATCSQIVAQVGTRWWSNRQVIAAPSDGRHTVEVRSFNQSAFSIEAIEVLDTQAPLAPGYYEEDNSEMRYDGFWRPRLSLTSLGTNIQVAETGGTVSFLVDANNFGGLDFFYRGGPEYGPVEICRIGGSCVIVDQERPSRQDSLLRSITPVELSMPVSGIQTITIERPSGSAFINIEALRILPQTPRALGPGYYEQEDPNFTPTGSWFTLTNFNYSNKSVLRTVQTNAEFQFTIGGGTTAEEQVTGFAVFTTLRTTPTTFDICYTRQSTGTEICKIGLSTQSPISTFVTPYGNSVYGLHPLEGDDTTNETYTVRVIHRGSGPFDIDAISVYGNYGASLAENTTSNPFYNDDADEIVYPFAWSRLFDDQYQGGTGAFVEIVGVPQQVTVEGSSVTIYIPIAEDLSNQVRFCVISDGAADQRCATFSQNSAIGTETTSVPLTFFGLGTGTKKIIIENLDPTRRAVIEAISVH